MPAPSVYPAAYDDFVTNKVGTDPKTGHADAHNLIGAAIEGVEAELGLNPSGSWATLKARLDYLWDGTDTPAAGDALLWNSGVGKFDAGKIGNIQIDSAAAIGIAKLAGYPGDSSKFLRGDGVWNAPPVTVLPTHPYVILRHSANQSIINGSPLVSAFDTEEADAWGMHGPSSSTITLAETGVWLISFAWLVDNHANGYHNGNIWHDQLGSAIVQGDISISPNTGSTKGQSIHRLMYLAAGNTLHTRITQNSGGTETCYGGRYESPVFSAFKLI